MFAMIGRGGKAKKKTERRELELRIRYFLMTSALIIVSWSAPLI